MIEILEITQINDALAEMVALFRVELRSYKGIVSKPDVRKWKNIFLPSSRYMPPLWMANTQAMWFAV